MSKITRLDVISLIEVSLGLSSGSLSENACAEEVEGWDSLGQLSILVALDKVFDGRIADLAEIATADSVQKILKILNENNLIEV